MDGRDTAPPFIQATFLLFVLLSIGLAFRGCCFAFDPISAPLVEGHLIPMVTLQTPRSLEFT